MQKVAITASIHALTAQSDAVEHTPTASSLLRRRGGRVLADVQRRISKALYACARARKGGRRRTGASGSVGRGRRAESRDMVSAGNRPGGAAEKLPIVARHILPLVS
jgi:hypothetical protein